MMFRTGNNKVYDTTANFTNFDPIILKGVIAISWDSGQAKIGNGSTRWSSLDYIGGTTIGPKYVESGSPTNCEIPRYSSSSDMWEYTLHGAIDTATNWSSNSSVFPTFAILIEVDDVSAPTERIKISDGITSQNNIPWIWFDFANFPTGYTPYYNGTTIDLIS